MAAVPSSTPRPSGCFGRCMAGSKRPMRPRARKCWSINTPAGRKPKPRPTSRPSSKRPLSALSGCGRSRKAGSLIAAARSCPRMAEPTRTCSGVTPRDCSEPPMAAAAPSGSAVDAVKTVTQEPGPPAASTRRAHTAWLSSRTAPPAATMVPGRAGCAPAARGVSVARSVVEASSSWRNRTDIEALRRRWVIKAGDLGTDRPRRAGSHLAPDDTHLPQMVCRPAAAPSACRRRRLERRVPGLPQHERPDVGRALLRLHARAARAVPGLEVQPHQHRLGL